MKYYIGADIGTTSTKVVLFDEMFQNLDFVSKGYRTYQDKAHYAEQDPEEVFESSEVSEQDNHVLPPMKRSRTRNLIKAPVLKLLKA